jgi:hypothetical protein
MLNNPEQTMNIIKIELARNRDIPGHYKYISALYYIESEKDLIRKLEVFLDNWTGCDIDYFDYDLNEFVMRYKMRRNNNSEYV